MQQEIMIGQHWSEALREGDVETLLDLYHDHAVLDTPLHRLHGRTEIATALAEMPWHKLRRHELLLSDHRRDRVALMTRHGALVLDHVLHLHDGRIRGHRVSWRPG